MIDYCSSERRKPSIFGRKWKQENLLKNQPCPSPHFSDVFFFRFWRHSNIILCFNVVIIDILMAWDYNQYMDNPIKVISDIHVFLEADLIEFQTQHPCFLGFGGLIHCYNYSSKSPEFLKSAWCIKWKFVIRFCYLIIDHSWIKLWSKDLKFLNN